MERGPEISHFLEFRPDPRVLDGGGVIRHVYGISVQGSLFARLGRGDGGESRLGGEHTRLHGVMSTFDLQVHSLAKDLERWY